MTSIVITDIEDKNTSKQFLDALLNADFFSVDKFKTAKLTITDSSKTETKNSKLLERLQ